MENRRPKEIPIPIGRLSFRTLVGFGVMLIAIASGASGATAPQADRDGCGVTDLTLVFWRFWGAAAGKAPPEQLRLFEELVRKPNADVYNAVFEGGSSPIDERIASSLEASKAVEPAMRAVTAQLSRELPAQLSVFRKSFPDFRCSVPVYVLYSAGAFDGATRTVHGNDALMFGIDVIAQVDGGRLAPLVIHELFHVYHAQVVPDVPEIFFWSMWEEGLATYVSRRLNPKIPEAQACCLPPAAPIEAVLPRIAAEALSRLDSVGKEDSARFFLGGAKLDIPPRSGYYLGYLVAKRLGADRTLRELAAMKPEAVRPEIEKTLKELAKGPLGGC